MRYAFIVVVQVGKRKRFIAEGRLVLVSVELDIPVTQLCCRVLRDVGLKIA